MAFTLDRLLIFLIFTGHLSNFTESATTPTAITTANAILPPGGQQHSPNAQGGFSPNRFAEAFHTDGTNIDVESSHSRTLSYASQFKEKMKNFLVKHHITDDHSLMTSLKDLSKQRSESKKGRSGSKKHHSKSER